MEYDFIDKVPSEGIVLAFFSYRSVFFPYEVSDGNIIIKGEEDVDLAKAYECHFFDRDSEYRRIKRGSRGDIREVVLTKAQEDDMDTDLIFEEEVLVKPSYLEREGIPAKLLIVNRYRYSDNDLTVLDDYRISYR
ncbi:MAG: hypothetical protein J6X33_06885 [Clostridiales bacterium]|nr:hypothetical protein [Clostridiales bacterium]